MSENPTISEKELLDAIKNLLKKSGHLNKFQAEMRAKVTEVLQERQVLNPGFKSAGIPKPSDEVLLINELVKEYLEWNGYLYTASVMGSEAAMPNVRKTRAELCSEVGVKDDEKSSALPLLSNIIAAYTERIKRKISKIKRDH
ncbi:LisH domain-containing protein C16orf63 [Danaus plexippus plexippus]|uniref:LisH domain-containing protein C16orf63 n=2 Tax=Danaus plexippus plexippus TaxID=278856 RepID=A0A212F0Q4_DANPL|nr:LisH domain-containing protein C16orf63 [Danaus plexippus plexippus]